MSKKAKPVRHKLVRTRVWVVWCKGCGYMHMPELEIEMRQGAASKHHRSPYRNGK